MVKTPFEIVYEDKKIIVVYKKPHLLSISTPKEKVRTLYHEVLTYVKARYSNDHKIFVVHRLDKETSGLIVFAKSFEVKNELQTLFEEGKVGRYYNAIVSPIPNKKKATLKEELLIDKIGNVRVVKNKCKFSKTAITKYEIVGTKENKAILNIEILTGRKNQIRSALANIGSPILGDKKYGGQDYKRMCLNAYKLDLSSYDPKYVFEKKITF